jgi:hypothetical protein
VQARAFVPGRHLRQAVRRLEDELLLQLDNHDTLISSTRGQRRQVLHGGVAAAGRDLV